MKCTVDGVEYKGVRVEVAGCCKGCAAQGSKKEDWILCEKLENCETEDKKHYIWVKVEHG